MSLLEHEETLKLIARSKQGDREAQEILVLNNAALVKSIVKKYIGRGVDYDDLYQIGSLGLVKAIRNYDPGFNVRFSTYAVPMIMGEIKRFLRDDGMIKVSRSLKEIAVKIAAVKESLSMNLGREPTVSEIAREIDVEPEEIAAAMEASRPHMSINEPVYGDDSDTVVLDSLALNESEESGVVNKILLKELISQLEPRERQLIMLRYFQDKTQSEIAAVMGVSQVQVSRLETRILAKMRDIAK